ncbi:hypothetical protein N9046_04880 [Akkermansiaceae bacterium]|jgi:hypothetical protein|nr:hypothetical protein [Akkermansiaceae bacterium]MDA7532283.1 hypothetical protein [Akkermansiaceae bacterium]MDA7647243.1 hypothetical protein [Akkermansiaceae bacterium]MDB4469644.1 hypothetical protein [Akkermansiaceae bacterium]MDB4810477.1 hypothetical protein [Akkermansiaceae bacterium]
MSGNTPPSHPAFDGFWNWLQTKRSVPTLAGRSTVSGCADDKQLTITTSNNQDIAPISRAKVAEHSAMILRAKFEGLEANPRWIAALLKAYLGDWAR